MATKAKSAKSMSKSEILNTLAGETGLKRKEVSAFFDALSAMIQKSLRGGPGVFTVPGLLKLRCVHKPATAERPGVNPFTKEPMIIKAKPARNVVRAVPLKSLKDMV